MLGIKSRVEQNREELGREAIRPQRDRPAFDKRLAAEEKGKDLLSAFLDEVYLPWSKANKKSWRDDAYMRPMLKEYFEGKAF